MISIKFKTFGYNNRSVELCFVCLILTYWCLTSEMAPKRFLNFFCPFGNPNLPSQASLLPIFSKGAFHRTVPPFPNRGSNSASTIALWGIWMSITFVLHDLIIKFSVVQVVLWKLFFFFSFLVLCFNFFHWLVLFIFFF